MNYKKIQSEKGLKGKRVLMRVDLNVPIKDGVVTDDFRIQRILPTLRFLRESGAKIILIAHIESEETDSLEIVATYLNRYATIFPVRFGKEALSENAIQDTHDLAEGEVILFENLRLYAGEKKNDEVFAKALSGLGDVFVNEAFSVSHRAHASVVCISKFLPSFAGPLFDEEVTRLAECFDPPSPFLFILGGAKIDTKMPLVEKFLKIADTVFIGGALANDVFKAKGLEVGESVVSKNPADLGAILKSEKVLVPADVVVRNTGVVSTKKPDKVLPTDKILDAGENTIAQLREKINTAKFILWNGPLGAYEEGFKGPTLELAEAIAAGSGKAVVGGGDTLSAIEELHLFDKFSFVSTGGGAMLDYLANGTLPGIESLEKNA